MSDKGDYASNKNWIKRRKIDKVTKVISAFLLIVVLLKLNDLSFLLNFFYIVTVIGIITMVTEMITILKNK